MQMMSTVANRGQPNTPLHPVWPEDTDAHSDLNQLIVTDGGTFTLLTDIIYTLLSFISDNCSEQHLSHKTCSIFNPDTDGF